MKAPAPSVWVVQVRREQVCNVLVRHADPVEARRIGREEACDWVETEHAAAYLLEGKPNDRVWVDGEWLYPETGLFGAEHG